MLSGGNKNVIPGLTGNLLNHCEKGGARSEAGMTDCNV
jgi:hypothetical protein